MARWKEIEGYDGVYIISDYGKVINVVTSQEMRASSYKNNYKRIQLTRCGVRKKYFVHRLVAEAFIPNPNNEPIINHKDENPSNNNFTNLEWCSYQYNVLYGNAPSKRLLHTDYKNRKSRDPSTYKRGADAPNSRHVYQFDLEGNLLNEYTCALDAGRLNNFDGVSISKACLGRLILYKGFKWQFTPEFEKPRSKSLRTGLAVLQIAENGETIKRYEYSAMTAKDGFDPSVVNKVCKGKIKSHKGYCWKYEESE